MHEDLLGTGVVGDAQSRLLLDHVYSSLLAGPGARRICPATWPSRGSRRRRQRLVADSGRVSISETRSPTPAMFVLVVRLDLAGTADDLAVQRVLDAVLDLDDDGLVHLVADHQALAGLAVRLGSSSAAVVFFVAHACQLASSLGAAEPSSRSRMTV